MAITFTFKELKKRYTPSTAQYWKSFEEFEDYYLREILERLPDTIYYTNKDGTEIKLAPINHHPELKECEVWMEGYEATGESGTAQLLGKTLARNFAQACHIIECKSYLAWMEKENHPDYTVYSTPGRWDYNPSDLTIWGCKLYWNKELAEKSFG